MGENGMYRILVCDDERDIVSALRIYLTAEGYEVLEAYNGSEMLRLDAMQEVHLILLDVMMPGMDGLSAMAELRRTSNVPVILLTAKSEDTDKVLGLNLGADDYVTKPFNPIEVMARVRSQLRRYLQLGGGQVLPTQVTIGGIMLDDSGRTVTVDGEPVALTPTEFDILRLLMPSIVGSLLCMVCLAGTTWACGVSCPVRAAALLNPCHPWDGISSFPESSSPRRRSPVWMWLLTITRASWTWPRSSVTPRSRILFLAPTTGKRCSPVRAPR